MKFSIEDVRLFVELEFFPDEDEEHPLAEVAVVLVSAAHLGTTDPVALRAFTGCSLDLISAIYFNMMNNRLWREAGYDCAAWFEDGVRDQRELLDHVSIACGEMWLQGINSNLAVPTCLLYWAERDQERRARRLRRGR